jgi:hypothetical protein
VLFISIANNVIVSEKLQGNLLHQYFKVGKHLFFGYYSVALFNRSPFVTQCLTYAFPTNASVQPVTASGFTGYVKS